MEDKYLFRKIRKDEIPLMFRIITDRMKWMDKVGIRQWNVTKYDEVYPLSYYEEKRQNGEVFVLEEKATGDIAAAAVLKSEDERWASVTDKDDSSAFYLHNFAVPFVFFCFFNHTIFSRTAARQKSLIFSHYFTSIIFNRLKYVLLLDKIKELH